MPFVEKRPKTLAYEMSGRADVSFPFERKLMSARVIRSYGFLFPRTPLETLFAVALFPFYQPVKGQALDLRLVRQERRTAHEPPRTKADLSANLHFHAIGT